MLPKVTLRLPAPTGAFCRWMRFNTMTTQQVMEFVLMPNSQVPLTTDLPISMQIIALFRKFLGAIRIAPVIRSLIRMT